MTIESATYISDLNAALPASGDVKSEGDDHIRLLKTVAKATFPNVTGAVTPTHTELNYVDGVTSAIQTQLDAKAPLTTLNSVSAFYTLQTSDKEKCVVQDAIAAIATPASGTLSAGMKVWILNNCGSSIQIQAGSGVTLRLAGTGTTGTRLLAANGLAMLLVLTSAVMIVSGDGVT